MFTWIMCRYFYVAVNICTLPSGTELALQSFLRAKVIADSFGCVYIFNLEVLRVCLIEYSSKRLVSHPLMVMCNYVKLM